MEPSRRYAHEVHPPATTAKRSEPVLITDIERGPVVPSERLIRSLEAKIDIDPRWRED